GEGLAADSCGGSSGFDSPWERRGAPGFLFGRSTRPAHPEARDGRKPHSLFQPPAGYFPLRGGNFPLKGGILMGIHPRPVSVVEKQLRRGGRLGRVLINRDW